MKVSDLTGQDLAYLVARANNPNDGDIIREHYGNTSKHDQRCEESMRDFVRSKFGEEVNRQQKD